MHCLTVAPSGTHLLTDGELAPLVIDTAWSSFADPTEQEWRSYLTIRRRQGFTAVLVSALPIPHDRDERPSAREPYPRDAAGRPDFGRPDRAYFALAREYTRIAHEEFGLRLMVTVLWNNYLPGTWGADLTPHTVMPVECRRAYVRTVADTFGDLDPVFVVGGDDHYTVPAANAGYREAVALLRERAPDCLLTTHSAPNTTLPDDLADALDFHLHQSGHNVENQELTWRQPAQYLARRPRKPLIASEPPYEQHGKVNGLGRWTRQDVRGASWTSVLGGATAGIGYGAHGMWMWHTADGDFLARRASLEPCHWPQALAFPGALDISLLGHLLAVHRMHRLLPAQDLLGDDPSGGLVRCAASPDGDLVALYQPYGLPVRLRLDLTGHRIHCWDLAERVPLSPTLTVQDGHTIVHQLDTAADHVLIAERAA